MLYLCFIVIHHFFQNLDYFLFDLLVALAVGVGNVSILSQNLPIETLPWRELLYASSVGVGAAAPDCGSEVAATVTGIARAAAAAAIEGIFTADKREAIAV